MKTFLFLLLAAILVGGLALFGLFGDGFDKQENTRVDEGDEISQLEEPAEPETYAGIGTLTDLQNLNTPLECRITYNAPEFQTPVEGTYFVAGTNVRGDFELEIPELGGTSLSSVIFTESMFYSWSEINGQTYGMKMPVDRMAEVESEDVREPVPANVDVSYDCVSWKQVDYSIFEPPSQVLFQDMTTLMQGGMEYGTIYEEGEF